MNQTAQGLASFGRGPDSMLVHMAPGEVKSLQQLAMAHGGSLTINPQTGLPEAGFLSSMLPMLIGAGLTFATGGAAAPLLIGGMSNAATIGLGIGGLQALRTGSLKKGLMAGLGAYGGAGLAGGLMGAGAATAGDAAASGAFDASLGKQGLTAAEAAMDVSNPLAEQAAASARTAATSSNLNNLTAGAKGLLSEQGRNAFMQNIGGSKGLMQTGLAAAAPMMETTTKQPEIKTDKDMGQRYRFNAGTQTPTPTPDVPGYENQGINFGKEQRYFNPTYAPIDNEAARKLYGFASGGPVENMSNANAIGMNTSYPQADTDTGAYATPYQQPISQNMIPDMQSAQFAGGGSINLQGTFDIGNSQGGGQMGSSNNPQPFVGSNNARSMMPQQGATFLPDPTLDPKIRQVPTDMESVRQSMMKTRGLQELLKGPMSQGMAFAGGGISHLGDYSDGGRLLRGPGDGISDSIPAMIGKKQPARLADGEFVVPARIVSELGNGSTEAGARKLYAMMDRVQKARGKTVGKGKVAANSRSAKYLPA